MIQRSLRALIGQVTDMTNPPLMIYLQHRPKAHAYLSPNFHFLFGNVIIECVHFSFFQYSREVPFSIIPPS